MWRGRAADGDVAPAAVRVRADLGRRLLAAVALIANLVVVTFLTVVLGFFSGSAWITGYTLLGLEVEDAVRGRTFAFVQT